MTQPAKGQSDWDRLRDGSLDEAGLGRLLRQRPEAPDPADTERLRTSLEAELRAGELAEEPDFETLAAYVDQALVGADREVFESRLHDDPVLQAEVAELQALRAQLAHRSQARVLPFRARVALPLSGLAAAAALVLALLLSWRPEPGRPGPGQAQQPPAALKAAERVRLADGAGAVVLRADGSLDGLPDLPQDASRSLAAALGEGRLDLPARLAGLQGRAGVLMGAAGPSARLRVLGPLGTSVRSVRPEFHWQPLTGARVYVVSVYGENLTPVLRSPELASSASSWLASADLPRGRSYIWQVAAQVGEGRRVAPAPPEPEARFHVLAAEETRQLEQRLAAAGGSRLARGVLLAQAGVLDEAEQAFGELQAQNPGSQEVARLLKQVRQR